MKTLILSCNNGGGHNSVAAAIKDIYQAHNQDVDIIDGLSFLPKGWSKTISDFHVFVYRHMPDLADLGYRAAESNRDQFDEGHSSRELIDLGTKKLAKYIKSHKYDHVISCHIFAGMMLADAVQYYGVKAKTAIVETDYTVTPGSEEARLDYHFIPSIKQKMELMALYDIPEKNIVVTGIPVRGQFNKTIDKKKAKEQLGIDPNKGNIVVASGSMGAGPIEDVIEDLARNQGQGKSFSISIICGSNKELYKKLNRKFKKHNDIHIFGKVSDMSVMLDCADVYMTKAGGISTSEAAYKNTPMILIDAVGGCEKYNLEFFTYNGGALTAKEDMDLAKLAIRVCKDKALQKQMKKSLAKVENNQDLIYELMSQDTTPKTKKKKRNK